MSVIPVKVAGDGQLLRLGRDQGPTPLLAGRVRRNGPDRPVRDSGEPSWRTCPGAGPAPAGSLPRHEFSSSRRVVPLLPSLSKACRPGLPAHSGTEPLTEACVKLQDRRARCDWILSSRRSDRSWEAPSCGVHVAGHVNHGTEEVATSAPSPASGDAPRRGTSGIRPPPGSRDCTGSAGHPCSRPTPRMFMRPSSSRHGSGRCAAPLRPTPRGYTALRGLLEVQNATASADWPGGRFRPRDNGACPLRSADRQAQDFRVARRSHRRGSQQLRQKPNTSTVRSLASGSPMT